ncbi:hypothetical protein [Stappia sp.]|jgi:hypothetical protein|uniref:hypothetical protein n=1 Tax=Stappia sp. TaxID=1870903 RepID=UPI003A9A0760
MRIVAANRTGKGPGRTERTQRTGARPHRNGASAGTAGAGGSRNALVVTAVEPVVEATANRFARIYRPSAMLIAQLIALRENMPQQRARRRAEPAEAIDAYRSAERRPRTQETGRVLSVSR